MGDEIKTRSLDEADLEESFSRSSGPGGQKVNKVASRVTLRHKPTDITVTVQESRSQMANRQLARQRLLEAIQEKERRQAAEKRDHREKQRRRKAKRPRALKEKILREKRHRSLIKQKRRAPPE